MLMRKWRANREAVCLCLLRLQAKWGYMDSFFWSTIGTVEAERSKDPKKHLVRYLQKVSKIRLEVLHECLR